MNSLTILLSALLLYSTTSTTDSHTPTSYYSDVASSIREGQTKTLKKLLSNLPIGESLPNLLETEFCFTLTPLCYAAKTNPSTIATLLELGADPNTAHKETMTTPLMFASRSGEVEAAEILLSAVRSSGGDVDTVDSLGSTALSIVSLTCNYKVAEILLNAGADPSKKDNAGNNALHVAAWYCDSAAGVLVDGRFKTDGGATFARTLLRYMDAEKVDDLSGTGRSALMLSAMKGGDGFYNVLVEEGKADENKKSPKDEKTARELLSERKSKKDL